MYIEEVEETAEPPTKRARLVLTAEQILADMKPGEYASYLVDCFDISEGYFETVVFKNQEPNAGAYWDAVYACLKHLAWDCAECGNWCFCGDENQKVMSDDQFFALLEMRNKYRFEPPSAVLGRDIYNITVTYTWRYEHMEGYEEEIAKWKSILLDYESFGLTPWDLIRAVSCVDSFFFTSEEYKKMAEYVEDEPLPAEIMDTITILRGLIRKRHKDLLCALDAKSIGVIFTETCLKGEFIADDIMLLLEVLHKLPVAWKKMCLQRVEKAFAKK